MTLLRRNLPDLAALAVLLAAAGLLYARMLDSAPNYDEGVYMASLDALLNGQRLGVDVFTVQPPGFYLLVELLSVLFGNSVEGIRVGFLLLALVGLAAAYAAGRAVAGRGAGLAAAAVVAVAPPFPVEAARISSDVPSIVLSLVAIALAAYGFRSGAPRWLAPLAGVAFVLAVSVKIYALTALAPLAALAWANRTARRPLAYAVTGAAATVAAYAIAFADAAGPLWNGFVGAHVTGKDYGPTHLDNALRVVRLVDFRTPLGWLAVAGIVAAVFLALRRASTRTWPLWLWAAGAASFLIARRPLVDHHLALMAASLGLAAGASLMDGIVRLGRARIAALAAVAAFVAAGFVQEHRRLADSFRPYPPEWAWAVERIRTESGPDDHVLSDLPILAYLSDRRIPGPLVETSVTRVQTGTLTTADVVRELGQPRVKVVVVNRVFPSLPGLLDEIEARFPHRQEYRGIQIYSRG